MDESSNGDPLNLEKGLRLLFIAITSIHADEVVLKVNLSIIKKIINKTYLLTQFMTLLS